MVDNVELQELYSLLSDVLDGYNRTHAVQVDYVDFSVAVPESAYRGSVVCREYEDNIVDYHYRDLVDDDFDWFEGEEWTYEARRASVERILKEQRLETQAAHRRGRSLNYLWWVRRQREGLIPDDAFCVDRRSSWNF